MIYKNVFIKYQTKTSLVYYKGSLKFIKCNSKLLGVFDRDIPRLDLYVIIHFMDTRFMYYLNLVEGFTTLQINRPQGLFYRFMRFGSVK